MDRAKRTLGVWRSVAVALSVLAIALKVLTPSGFMLADQGSGFPLVICTGQGPMVLADHGELEGPSKSPPNPPCAFRQPWACHGSALGGEILEVQHVQLHPEGEAVWPRAGSRSATCGPAAAISRAP